MSVVTERATADTAFAEPRTQNSAQEKPATDRTSGGRILQLDVLRGLAIVLVIGRHSPIYPTETGAMFIPSGVWARFGWSGVDLFFVLSGFLVGGLLFREVARRGELDIKRFLVRRIFKIWPAYFVFLGIALIVLTMQSTFAEALRALVPNLLHLQNYLGTPLTHTWSLSVEEHFYLALPLLLACLLRSGGGAIQPGGDHRRLVTQVIGTFVVIAVGCFIARCLYAFTARPTNYEVMLTQTHHRMDSLFAGVVLSCVYYLRRSWWDAVAKYSLALFVLGLVLVAPMAVLRLKTNIMVPTVGLTMLYLGYACILVATLSTKIGEGFGGRFMGSVVGRILAFIGFYSYTIYLLHMAFALPLMQYLYREGILSRLGLELQWLLVMLLYIMVATFTGVLFSKAIERPSLLLRDKLFPSAG